MLLNSNYQIIGKTFLGLENVLADELREMGIKDIEIINRGVRFTGNDSTLYLVNLKSRTALRFLVPFLKYEAESPEELYDKAIEFDWMKLLSVSDTFVIDNVINSRYFKHSRYAALKLKDAIADHFKKASGVRPSVNTISPNYRINLHISDNKVTISLDSSGESLHKRGYRTNTGEAPLNEVLAAGLIKLSGWKGDCDLFDPMTGSGTIAIEAALMSSNTSPGLIRNSFGFMKWENFDEKLYKRIYKKVEAQIDEQPVKIFANDISPEMIKKATRNAIKAGLINKIKFTKKDFFEMESPLKNGFLIFNPPYDERLKEADIKDFYKKIGDTLKQKYSGCDAWIFSGNLRALKYIGLKHSGKHILMNGPIDSRLVHFELYSGSRKEEKL